MNFPSFIIVSKGHSICLQTRTKQANNHDDQQRFYECFHSDKQIKNP
jgi:hypothetical protein